MLLEVVVVRVGRSYVPPILLNMRASSVSRENLKCIQVIQRNLTGGESAPLLCRKVLYSAGDSVALAVGLHRVHPVVVGRPRLEVVQVHAKNRR